MDVPTGKHKQAQLSPLSFSKKFVSKNYYGVTVQKFTFLHLPQFLFLSCCLVVSSVFQKAARSLAIHLRTCCMNITNFFSVSFPPLPSLNIFLPFSLSSQ